jgi:hypothetical protein
VIALLLVVVGLRPEPSHAIRCPDKPECQPPVSPTTSNYTSEKVVLTYSVRTDGGGIFSSE